jgi:hypothetical protein
MPGDETARASTTPGIQVLMETRKSAHALAASDVLLLLEGIELLSVVFMARTIVLRVSTAGDRLSRDPLSEGATLSARVLSSPLESTWTVSSSV